MPADVHLVDSLENVLRDDRNETEASVTATVDTPASAPTADASDASSTTDDARLNRTTDATTTTDGLEPDQPPAPPTIDRPAIEINLTADEIQIPVFSEWTQKRREEEAEKEVDQEAIQLNTSAQRKNASATSRPPVLRLRTGKNYASPDCNAKIIAANSESQAIGHVLTASKDEYLLSPCDSRIWFVVELCEAMQAERIEMANFELFSSTPRNFSVGVSSRFPTRDWTNVGRFEAQDERFLQSFDLHPHLFGKYMRVDIHSHYASEHFCPISIFRVYGTSEFEAFETENRPHPLDDLDEDDEDDQLTADVTKNKSNIFRSASEAVMSIVDKVKKAASFVKPSDDRPKSRDTVFDMYSRMNACVTPNYVIHCDNCTTELTNKVIALLQCKQRLLNRLIAVEMVRNSLRNSHMCADLTGLDFNVNCSRSMANASSAYQLNDKQMEYIAHLFAPTYIMAMCNLLAAEMSRPVFNSTVLSMPGTAFNVSVDRKAAGTLMPNARNLSTELPKESNEQSDKVDVPGVADEGAVNLSPTIGTTEPAAANADAAKEKEAAGGERVERVDATISATSGEHTVDESDKLEQNIFNIPAEVPSGDGKEPQPPTDASGKIDIEPEPATPPTVIFVPEPNTPHPAPAQQAPPTPTNDPVDAGDDQALSTPQNGAGQKQHGESVFLRLSNRVKV